MHARRFRWYAISVTVPALVLIAFLVATGAHGQLQPGQSIPVPPGTLERPFPSGPPAGFEPVHVQVHPLVGITPEDLLPQVCAWWDSLGYPDVSECAIVRYPLSVTGTLFEETHRYQCGFVLAEREDALDVLSIDGEFETIPRQTTRTFGTVQEVTPVEFEHVARTGSWHWFVGGDWNDPPRIRSVRPLGAGVVAFPWAVPENPSPIDLLRELLLARQCAARGLAEASLESLGVVIAMLNRVQMTNKPEEPMAICRAFLSDLFYLRALRALAMPHSDWETTLRAMSLCVANAGEDEPHRLAVEDVAILNRMIAEHQTRARTPRPLFEVMTSAQQAEELAYRLRFMRRSDPRFRSGEHIYDPPREEESPYDQLVRMGLPAIPALIELLGDRGFTRICTASVGMRGPMPRNGWDGELLDYREMRLHDLAMNALIAICGTHPQVLPGEPFAPEWVAAYREHYRAWLARAEEIGLPAVWEEAVRENPRNQHLAATHLRLRFPEHFLAAVRPVIASEAPLRDIASLMRDTLRFGTPEAIDMVVARLERESGDHVAFSLLHSLSQTAPDRCDAVLAGWFGRLPTTEDWRHRGVRFGSDWLEASLRHGPGAAFAAMVEWYWRADAHYQKDLLEILHHVVVRNLRGERRAAVQEAEAVEAFLIDAMTRQDDAHVGPLSYTLFEGAPDDLRLCDLAGASLAALWPARYRFDVRAARFEREVQRVACVNAWRAPRGLELLPLPEPPPPIVPPYDEPQSQPQSRPGRR